MWALDAMDLVTPYFASKLLIAQLPPLGGVERVQLKLYGGGHVLYLDEASRKALRADVERLIGGE